MSKVTVHLKNFKGPYAKLNGTRELRIPRRAILRAALTLGFQHNRDVISMSGAEWYQRIGRFLSAIGSLEQVHGSWVAREEFLNLDGSDKGAQSYSIGMIFAKLVAESCLDVPWLAHVDDMKSKGLLTISEKSKERGDMVGRDSSLQWHVVEAKGRSSSFPEKLVQKAKDQAAAVTSVHETTPATNSACISSLWTDPIEILLDDPESKDGISWKMDEKDFWHNYYDGIINYINDHRAENESVDLFKGFIFADLSPILDNLPPAFRNTFSPLPLYVGIPDFVFSEPRAAARLPGYLAEESILPSGADGFTLLGPIKQFEKKKDYD